MAIHQAIVIVHSIVYVVFFLSRAFSRTHITESESTIIRLTCSISRKHMFAFLIHSSPFIPVFSKFTLVYLHIVCTEKGRKTKRINCEKGVLLFIFVHIHVHLFFVRSTILHFHFLMFFASSFFPFGRGF